MKYKRLGTGELKELEKEFVHFLSSAQITGNDWEKMKASEPQKAEELLDVFSDLVYEKVMNRIDYLEYREKKSLNVFHFTEEKVILRGLRVKEQSALDLTAENLFEHWDQSSTNGVELVKSEKKYGKDKGTEVFEMLQTGCLITDGKLFGLLDKL